MNEWDKYKIKIPKPGERGSDASVLEDIIMSFILQPHAVFSRTERSAQGSFMTRAA